MEEITEMMEVTETETETETEEAAVEQVSETEAGILETETEYIPESSELMDEELPATTEAVMLVEVDNTAELELLTQMACDVRIILVFTILTYCSACMRRWRNATIKGGR